MEMGGIGRRNQAAIDSEGFSVGVEGEGGAQCIAVGWNAVFCGLRDAIKDRQIEPGWLKIGFGTSKGAPYFTSAWVITFFRINQSHHVESVGLTGV